MLLLDWCVYKYKELSRWLSNKESACNAGDAGGSGSTLGSGRSPGGGHGNPPQYSCLGNPMDRGTWQATVHGVTEELDMTSTKQQQQTTSLTTEPGR